jgi:Asp-tRNA(Asn)/Glu-tRNA(Gln) amidotransferase A subunit family amidase
MSYDLKSLRIPNIWGLPLKTLVGLLENGYSRKMLESPIIKEAGINKLREMRLNVTPTMTPKYPPGRSISSLNALHTLEQLNDEKSSESPTKGFRTESVIDFAKAYRSGQTTPEEVAKKVIEAINQSNEGKHPINAIINWSDDDILRQAKASALRFADGYPRGLLDGVPVAVKDQVDAIPYTTALGTQIFGQDHSAEDDSTVVARLRSAGAIIIGKTHMHEIGIGVTGQNAHLGVCRNPYSIAHHTGGSSSGSAAAVASGLCPLSIAADGGGSIRIPAALCGVVGLKATWGRISGYGAAPLCWSVGHIGPIGATVNDVALGYTVMAGPDTKDPLTLEQPTPHLKDYHNDNLKKIRIGIYTPWFEHASEDVVAHCLQAMKILQAQGATSHEIQIAHLDAQRIAHAVTISSEMLTAIEEEYVKDRSRFGLDTRINLAIANAFNAKDYIKAQQIRTLAMKEFQTVFEDVDVILTPTTGIVAPKINEQAQPKGESNLGVLTELMRFAIPGNLTGLPALTVNAGYDKFGLPVGIQLMGRPWEEHLLLQLGRIIEERIERIAPKVQYSLL